MASEQFSLCWDNFHKNMSSGMNSLLENEDLVDVTLAVEGKCLKAHKMVLSVCSPYFKELFKSNPCQHPIVFMKDVSYEALSDLLQFMYQGEVQVSQENLTTFIKTAEALQIKGLTGDGNGSADSEASEVPTEKPQVQKEEYKQVVSRPKKQPAPTSIAPPQVKRSRLSVSSNESQPLPATVVSKTESSLVISPTESPHFKMEPYEQSHHSMTAEETGDENFGDETLDDHTVEDTEDYSMMETGGADEPQAGTSTDGTGEGQEITILKSGSVSDANGFTYHQNTNKRGNRYYVCSEYKKLACRARMVLKNVGMVLRSEHNHPPPEEEILKCIFLQEIKMAIYKEPSKPLKEIYNLIATVIPQGAKILAFVNVHPSMRRWRSLVMKNKTTGSASGDDGSDSDFCKLKKY